MRTFTRKVQRLAAFALGLMLLSSIASAHYRWVYFASRTGSNLAVPVRFDLSNEFALPNKTVSYFISDQGPGPLVAGDSFTAIVSQIQAAAKVWNDVPTSALRLQFGGIAPLATPQNSPGIDIVFDDNLPPGIIAQTKPIISDDLSSIANGATSIPILRSRVQLPRNMTSTNIDSSRPPLASWQDVYFTVLVHELGHALGLQHPQTSSAMSTLITRATTKAAPLAADDIAGISSLYPTQSFLASTGTIRGRVTLSGASVNLASVVALSPSSGAAVSAFSDPYGNYQIDGVPPGEYYIYVHPLPPGAEGGNPGDVFPPQDRNHEPFLAENKFAAQFFNGGNGTREWSQAAIIPVTAGGVNESINFYVQRSNGPTIYGMQTYTYLGSGQTAVPAGPVVGDLAYNTVQFYAPGTFIPGRSAVTQGLKVSVIGNVGEVHPQGVGYNRDDFLYLYVNAKPVSVATPVAFAVTVGSELYVLPAAYVAVPSAGPTITALTPNDERTAIISGANLRSDTRITFDGALAKVLSANPDGSLTVSAPPATGGYRATVEALSSDGQTSAQILGKALPPVFSYAFADAPSFYTTPPALPAGTDAMVEVTGINSHFIDGQTSVGFGSSDVTVRRLWVISPNRVLVNVSVNAGAAPILTTITVTSGLQLVTLTSGFQILPNSGQTSIRVPIVNAANGVNSVPLGGNALISLTGPFNLSSATLTIDGQKATFTSNVNNQLLAQIPAGVATGPVIVRLVGPNGEVVPPVVMQIDPASVAPGDSKARK
jgi:hypothetical protein